MGFYAAIDSKPVLFGGSAYPGAGLPQALPILRLLNLALIVESRLY
jgi:hypothetical protein